MNALHTRLATFAVSTLSMIGLAACSGGGGSSANTVGLASGDALTYTVSTTPSGTATTTTSYQTNTYSSIKGAQITQVVTLSVGGAQQTLNYLTRDVLTSSTQGAETCTRTGSASTLRTFPLGSLSTGKTWDYKIQEDCTTQGATVTNTIVGSGKVLGSEDLTLDIGTFSTTKYQLTEIINSTSGNVENHQYICWRDTTLHVPVKCTDSVTVVSSDATSVTVTKVDRTLKSMSVADLPAQSPTVERFAGAWNFSYSGSDSGSCTLQIGTDGSVAAPSCYSDTRGSYFTLSGTVDSAGALTVTSSSGQTITGTLSSPLVGSGTWIASSSSQGNWSLAHR